MKNKKYLFGGVVTSMTLCSVLVFNSFVFPNVLASTGDTSNEINVVTASAVDEASVATLAGIGETNVVTAAGIDETNTVTGAGIDKENFTTAAAIDKANTEGNDINSLLDITEDTPDINAISEKKAVKLAIKQIKRDHGLNVKGWDYKTRYVKAQAPLNNAYWSVSFLVKDVKCSEALNKISGFSELVEYSHPDIDRYKNDKIYISALGTINAMTGEVITTMSNTDNIPYSKILDVCVTDLYSKGVLQIYGGDGLLISASQPSQYEYEQLREELKGTVWKELQEQRERFGSWCQYDEYGELK